MGNYKKNRRSALHEQREARRRSDSTSDLVNNSSSTQPSDSTTDLNTGFELQELHHQGASGSTLSIQDSYYRATEPLDTMSMENTDVRDFAIDLEAGNASAPYGSNHLGSSSSSAGTRPAQREINMTFGDAEEGRAGPSNADNDHSEESTESKDVKGKGKGKGKGKSVHFADTPNTYGMESAGRVPGVVRGSGRVDKGKGKARATDEDDDDIDDVLDYHKYLTTGGVPTEADIADELRPKEARVIDRDPEMPVVVRVIPADVVVDYTTNNGDGSEKFHRAHPVLSGVKGEPAVNTAGAFGSNEAGPSGQHSPAAPDGEQDISDAITAEMEDRRIQDQLAELTVDGGFPAEGEPYKTHSHPVTLFATTPNVDIRIDFRLAAFQAHELNNGRFKDFPKRRFVYDHYVHPQGGHKDNNVQWHRVSVVSWQHIKHLKIDIHVWAKISLGQILKSRNAMDSTNMFSKKWEGETPVLGIHGEAFRQLRNMVSAFVPFIVAEDPAIKYEHPPWLKLAIRTELRVKTKEEEAVYRSLHSKKPTHLACMPRPVLENIFEHLDRLDAFNLGLTCKRLNRGYVVIVEQPGDEDTVGLEAGLYGEGEDIDLEAAWGRNTGSKKKARGGSRRYGIVRGGNRRNQRGRR